MQHAPVGGGGAHVVFVHTTLSPRYCPPIVWAHASGVSTWQMGPAKPWKQHAPVRGGLQRVVVQATLTPRHEPDWAAHCCSVRTTQTGVAELGLATQHAPVGAGSGHGLVEQSVLAPCHVPPPAWHSACVRSTHVIAPEATRQHAPTGGGGGRLAHEVDVHTVPAPNHVPPSATQFASARTEQFTAPAGLRMQHAPEPVVF